MRIFRSPLVLSSIALSVAACGLVAAWPWHQAAEPRGSAMMASQKIVQALHRKPQESPRWAVRYGHEFWHRPTVAVHAKATHRAADLERVAHAIRRDPQSSDLYVSSRTYRASFDDRGLRFVPRLAAVTSRSRSTSRSEGVLHTTAIRHGDAPLYEASRTAPQWSVVGNTAQALLDEKTGLVEHYEARNEGIEVTWVLPQRPAGRGELTIEAEMQNLRFQRRTAQGVYFADTNGAARVRVSHVRVADAAGRDWNLPLQAKGHQLKVPVPQTLLAQATYPLAIDPTVSSVADGSLDTSFDDDGIVTTNIGGFSSSDEANALSIQNDGKIVAAGFSSNGSDNDFTVVRYNTDGSLDTSFDSDGIVTTNVGAFSSYDDVANAVAIQSDGKIVAAGSSSNGSDNDFALVRYNSNGSLDTGFDSDGKLTTNIGDFTSTDDMAKAVAIQSDGKIVAAGSFNNNNTDFAIVRYNSVATDPTFSVSDQSVSEGSTQAAFTVTLSPASKNLLTVQYSTANNTALSGSDYTATSGTLTFNSGDTSKTITVPILNDTLDEAEETFFVNLSNASNATPIADAQGMGTITDDDLAPTVSINDKTVTEGNSGTTNATFTVTLSSVSGQNVTVPYFVSSNTAFPGSDYGTASDSDGGTPGTLTFPAGLKTRTITVPIVGDTIFENNETFSIYLYNALNASIADSLGVGTITNDDSIGTYGGKIAYQGLAGDQYEIMVMNANGFNQVQLTNSPAWDGLPAFNRAGTKIAFASMRDGNSEIYAMNADGSNLVRLTNNTANDYYPTWSPDGSRIAFHSSRDGNGEIYIMNADGTGQTRLTNTTTWEDQPHFSPTGSKIVYNGASAGNDINQEIYVMNFDGTGQTRLTNNTALDDGAEFSPDGTKIVFASARDYTDNNCVTYTMNADGSNQTRVANTTPQEFSPTWSPDGSKIAVGRLSYMWTMNADGTGQMPLASGTVPTWAPGDIANLPSVTINDVNVTEGNSGNTNATFTVGLSAAVNYPVWVNYATANGTTNPATEGSDYTAASGTLSFNAGEQTKTVSVPVAGDSLAEPNETFLVNLSGPVNGNITDGQGVGTIVNDEADTVAPTVFITTPTPAPNNSYTGGFTSAGIASDAGSGIATVCTTVYRYNSSSSSYSYYNWRTGGWDNTYVQGNSDYDKVATGTTSWSQAIPVLPSGNYILAARAYDVAGNASTRATRAFRIDTAAPIVNITKPGVAPGNAANDAFVATGTASDADAGLARVITFLSRYNSSSNSYSYYNWRTGAWDNTYVQDSSDYDKVATGTGNWSQPIPWLNPGSYTLGARAYDRAGNMSTDLLRAFTVETTVPTVSITTPGVAPNNYYSASFTATGTAADAGSGVAKVATFIYRYDSAVSAYRYYNWRTTSWDIQYVIGNTDYDRTATGTTSWSQLIPRLSPDKYWLGARAYDRAGNISTTATRVFLTENTLPTISITTPGVSPNNSYSGVFTATGTASDVGSGLARVTIVIYRYDSSSNSTLYYNWRTAGWDNRYVQGSSDYDKIANGTSSWSQAISTLSVGTYTLSARAYDKAGNASAAATRAFKISGSSISGA